MKEWVIKNWQWLVVVLTAFFLAWSMMFLTTSREEKVESTKQINYGYLIDINLNGDIISYNWDRHGIIEIEFKGGRKIIWDKQNNVLLTNEKFPPVLKPNTTEQKDTTSKPQLE